MKACDFPLPNVTTSCDLCTIAFTVLEDFVEYAPTEKEIEFLIDYICNIFPSGTDRNECDQFMDQETGDLISWLSNSFPP